MHGRAGGGRAARRWTRRRAGAVALACAVLGSVLLIPATGAGGAVAGTVGGAKRLVCDGPATARSSSQLRPIAKKPKPALPVTYTDITGKPVTITNAKRILAVDSYGTLASTVYALGLGDRLVGRDVSTGIPALRHLPLVTHNGHELSAEAILDLHPTVMLTDYTIGPLEVQLQLRDAGIPIVIMSDHRSRDQIGPQIQAVADVLGVPDVGRQLVAHTDEQVTAAEARVASLAPAKAGRRLRMVFLYMRGNAGVYYWFGKGSGADDLITDLGGVDVASEAGLSGMRPLNAEGLVKADPDLYLMMTLGLKSVGGVTGLLEVPGVSDTNAGLNGCVVDMTDYQVLSFGPQYPATLDALATAIYTRAAPAPGSSS